MTQQYLVGELSLRLAQLHDAAGRSTLEHAVTQLRREAEAEPLESLSRPLLRALTLGDELCWDCLERGEAASFNSLVAVCADLHDFGVCSSIIAE
jgi:hypothetical protein